MAMRPGKCGIALPGAEVDVVDENGKTVLAWNWWKTCTSSSLSCDDAYRYGDRQRYEREWQKIPGCYTTGDVAVRDAEGYITVLGRVDDVLNVAGHRIGTAEVESALVSHPAVAEAAAIGIPDALKGEVIKAFVQCRAGQIASDELAATLIEHVRRELGPIATPSAIEFVAALPKTRSGKILRRYLKAREQGFDPGDISTLEA